MTHNKTKTNHKTKKTQHQSFQPLANTRRVLVASFITSYYFAPEETTIFVCVRENHQKAKMKFGIRLLPIFAFCLIAGIQKSLSYVPSNKVSSNEKIYTGKIVHKTRRSFIQETPAVLLGLTTLFPSSPAIAKEEPVELPTREAVTAAFSPIKFELQDPKGGVAYMQQKIDEQDWVGLMEFTKGYDLELRKKSMGRAKKLLQSKEIKNTGTEYSNAVTFDLIGMNRNSRTGQESVEGANKYLQELREDIAKFLTLEATIEVEG